MTPGVNTAARCVDRHLRPHPRQRGM